MAVLFTFSPRTFISYRIVRQHAAVYRPERPHVLPAPAPAPGPRYSIYDRTYTYVLVPLPPDTIISKLRFPPLARVTVLPRTLVSSCPSLGPPTLQIQGHGMVSLNLTQPPPFILLHLLCYCQIDRR